jgi:hypothetical protein
MSLPLRKVSALLLLAGFALAGCEDQRLLEMFDNKARLSGNRVPVFPDGVPGVQQGVPPELQKGYQAQVEQQAQAATSAAGAEKAAAEEKKRAAEERKRAVAERPKPKRVAQPPARQAPQSQPETAPEAEAAPRQQPTSAPLADRWPSAQPEPAPAQQAPQQSATTRPWPGGPPPSDRFTR